MGIHSGKFGVVNGKSTVRDWSITDSMSPVRYSASNTKFGMGSRRGVESWSGSFNHYGHTPLAMPGDSFSFLGYTAPDDDVSGAGMRYSGTAFVESAVINWDWATNAIINGAIAFQGHMALTAEVGAQVKDQTVPTVPVPVGTKIEYSSDDGGTWTEWDNLLNASLTFSNALQSYVNSSTAIAGRLWTGRLAGGIDWALSVTEQDARRDRFTKGDSLVFRLYVTDALYYELTWGQINDFTGLNVNRESGAIMQQTVGITMDGFDPAEAAYADATGSIFLPGGTKWWPATYGTGS